MLSTKASTFIPKKASKPNFLSDPVFVNIQTKHQTFKKKGSEQQQLPAQKEIPKHLNNAFAKASSFITKKISKMKILSAPLFLNIQT